MNPYHRILAVIDFSPHGARVAARAQQLANAGADASLTLLHIVEYLPVEPMNDSLLPAVQLEADLIARARQRMQDFASELAAPAPHWEVGSGNIKSEIVRYAREGDFDLIVIGSHERHGLSILVNLTEDTVLHAAPCDVLAVRPAAVESIA
ncbi:MAG: universal stress protein [Steroidobacteraceae bacterium]